MRGRADRRPGVAVAALALGLATAPAAAYALAATPASPASPTSGPAQAPGADLKHILDSAPASDWRSVDPEDTLYLTLPQGLVIIELAPAFAPAHVANVKALARAGFYDGLYVVRVQDGYVVQFGDADSARPTGEGRLRLAPEFDRPIRPSEPFVALADVDTYAPQTGFAGDFPAARDPAAGLTWLTHCYGMVGAGRDVAPDSGGGPELYAVIGQAPRQLDRNVTLLGRVVEGMDILASLPRGRGAMGFYESPTRRIPILSLRVAGDLPPAQRIALQVLRADSPSFAAMVRERRDRSDAWFVRPAGHVDVCNVPPMVRRAPAK